MQKCNGVEERLSFFFEKSYFSANDWVLCRSCMEWRKASGFHQHLETCHPEGCGGRCGTLAFAKAQLVAPAESFKRYEGKYGRLPDYVVADAPWNFKELLSRRYYGGFGWHKQFIDAKPTEACSRIMCAVLTLESVAAPNAASITNAQAFLSTLLL